MKYLLLDGFNLAFRSYYALPELTRSDGVPTGALHGWIKTLWKLEDMEQPDVMAVFYDEGGSDRHSALLPDYKANRTEMPEPLQQQLPVIQELTHRMGCPVVVQSGVEADDLIGSAAKVLSKAQHDVIIVSADKDLGQSVGGPVQQLLPAPTANPRIGWRKLDREGIEAKFGVSPEQVPDYLALVGDSSDNIPGIAGVGPKTAAKWLNAYGSIAGILKNAAAIKPARFQSVIAGSRELLERNLQLVTLQCTHPIPELKKNPPDAQALASLLESMEMKQAAAQAWERYGLGLGA